MVKVCVFCMGLSLIKNMSNYEEANNTYRIVIAH